jgi:hypothetical protein
MSLFPLTNTTTEYRQKKKNQSSDLQIAAHFGIKFTNLSWYYNRTRLYGRQTFEAQPSSLNYFRRRIQTGRDVMFAICTFQETKLRLQIY